MPELDAEHRDAILGVLRANGLTDQPADYDSDIHSWRCSYPDRYGPCTCLDELADDLAPLVAGWLADAWDEAIHHVEPSLFAAVKRSAMADNPYRGGDGG